MRGILKGIIFAMAIAGVAHAQTASKPFVIDNQGNRIAGDALKANDQGDLQLQIGGATQAFRRGTYREAWVPKPQNVARLEQALEQERYDVIVGNARAVFDEFKFLGWGGRVAYLHGIGLLEQDKAREALTVLQQGEPFAGRYAEDIVKGQAEANLALNNDAEAATQLEKLKASRSPETAAFAFNATGQLLQKQQKTKDAILEYLKTVLLFEPGTVARERKDAKARAVALLKDIGDERWKLVEAIE